MLATQRQTHERPPSLPPASHILPDPFVFVPITKAEAAKGRGRAKRIVRAHVTRVQHAKSSTTSTHQYLQPWSVRTQAPVSIKGRPTLQRALSSEESRDSESSKSSHSTIITIPSLPGTKRNGAGRQDPFWTYPVDYLPYLPAIFAHYIENVAVNIPDLDGPNEKGLLRRTWFPLAMEEAATMYAVLLMAASHYYAICPGSLDVKDLVYLKARALTAINDGIRDPQRAVSDAMIGAVMKMAAYEAVFGDSAIFATHMQGLGTMLKMRGGLSKLGLNGLLERMVVWIDLNAAVICGLSQQFGNEVFPTKVKFLGPDLYHFAGIQ